MTNVFPWMSCLRLLVLFSLCLGICQTAEARTRKEFPFEEKLLKKKGLYTLATEGGGKRTGLLVYFHGSGSTASYASNFDNIDKVAASLGLSTLSIQAPNGHDTWANAETGPRNRHDEYVRSVLDKVFMSNANIDKNRILFVGLSAGATFLSGDFLPAAISRYRGGAILLCGGGGPLTMTKELFQPLTPSVASRMPISAYIQQADFLYRQTMQGIGYWKSRKAEVTVMTPPGGSHCGFDVYKEMERMGKAILSQ